jgi:hypothetical protein
MIVRWAFFAGFAAVAAACGLTVTGGDSDAGLDGDAAARSATVQDGGRIKDPITTFACGTATCTAGNDACCATATTFACQPLDAGCQPDDSGPPPGPPLTCTTSDGCPGQEICCYDATKGSACTRDHCPTGQVELCVLGTQTCGEDSKCETLATAPAPSVGWCHNYD